MKDNDYETGGKESSITKKVGRVERSIEEERKIIRGLEAETALLEKTILGAIERRDRRIFECLDEAIRKQEEELRDEEESFEQTCGEVERRYKSKIDELTEQTATLRDYCFSGVREIKDEINEVKREGFSNQIRINTTRSEIDVLEERIAKRRKQAGAPEFKGKIQHRENITTEVNYRADQIEQSIERTRGNQFAFLFDTNRKNTVLQSHYQELLQLAKDINVVENHSRG